MNNKKLFGITALFNTPDEIIKAAEKVSDEGFTKFDVNTPYPVHGMDNAMKLNPSKLGFITLSFGLTGTAIALFFMYYTQSIDYPMNIGGKPYFSLPAFLPVTFEVTVLLATLSTVIGMFTFFFKFPHNNHPLHDTSYMKKVSVDKFGLCIEADDPEFDENKIRELFIGLGSSEIEAIYYPEDKDIKMFAPKFLGFLALIAVITSITTYFVLNYLLYVVPFSWMSNQDKITVQKKVDFFGDGFGVRPAVSGTVARSFLPYEYKGMPQPVMPLTNPFLADEKNISLGKKKYDTFCSPCHGYFGEGDSRLRGQFPNPPSLHSEKVRTWQDGEIYHVIVNGQNVMASYAPQLSIEERWAIINYIRVLQKAKNPNEDDIQFAKKESQVNVTK